MCPVAITIDTTLWRKLVKNSSTSRRKRWQDGRLSTRRTPSAGSVSVGRGGRGRCHDFRNNFSSFGAQRTLAPVSDRSVFQWNLKRSVASAARRNGGAITSHGVTRIPINPNAPVDQPHASYPMVEEACTTGSEISINL